MPKIVDWQEKCSNCDRDLEKGYRKRARVPVRVMPGVVRKLQVCHRCYQRYLANGSFQLLDQRKYGALPMPKLRRMRKKGWGYKRIGDALGVPKDVVRRRLKEAGLA
jgi:hypothetical protein